MVRSTTASAEQYRTSNVTDEKADSSIVVGDIAGRVALDIIGVAGLGQDFNSIEDPQNDLTQTYRKVLAPSRSAKAMQFLSLMIPPWILTMLPYALMHSIITLHGSSIERCG